MLSYILFTLYIAFSSAGLVLIKKGSTGLSLSFDQKAMIFSVNPQMLLGVFLYVVSFLLFLAIIPKFNLSYIYPVSAGLLYTIIIISSFVFLGERAGNVQLIGIFLILVGVIAISVGYHG